MRLLEFPYLVGLNLKVKLQAVIEQRRVARRFYDLSDFSLVDSHLRRLYRKRSPYRVSSDYLKQQGVQNPYTYGETPLTTLAAIAETFELQSDDVIYELGCGTGRCAFWLHLVLGCRVVGIEQIPIFVQRAQYLVEEYGLENIHFSEEDFLNTSLDGATVIYLHTLCLQKAVLDSLIDHLSRLRGVKIVTVGESLAECSPAFRCERRLQAAFPWGHSEVFLQTVEPLGS